MNYGSLNLLLLWVVNKLSNVLGTRQIYSIRGVERINSSTETREAFITVTFRCTYWRIVNIILFYQ